MALQGGYRFAVSMADAFPDGLYAMGVEQAEDYDEKTGRRTPAKDKQTGEYVWTVVCIDRDPMARKKEIKVKVSAPHMPPLPDEIAPGAGLRAVEFSGLTITPYIEETGRRPRMAHSYRALGVHAQGKVPVPQPNQRPGASSQGEGKAA